MDVEGWLRRLGMEQYASAFRDNAIDAEVLPRLTAEDLKDIGVAAVGHRRKLLDAIAALGVVPAPLEALPRLLLLRLARRTKPSAGRSPSCSAILSARPAWRPKLDAEDWRELGRRLSRRGFEGGDASTAATS